MATHYLAINHESYDSSTVFGVFDDLAQAIHHLEAEAAKSDTFTSARTATIEVWDGSEHIATWERSFSSPLIWEESRY